jgi:hypothetical protein
MQYTDRIILLKSDGRILNDIPCSCQPDIVFIQDETVPVEEGDIIERKLPSGIVETLTVIDPGYYGKHAGFPAYQVKVKRTSQIRKSASTSIVYNINGPNAKVNIDTHDQSINNVNISPDDLFQKLVYLATEQAEANKELLVHISEMKATVDTPSFVEKYQNFITSAANHITIFAPLIPALTQLIK